MLSTVPPNWKPISVKPKIRRKRARGRLHPVGCGICGGPAGSFLPDDPGANFATCFACYNAIRMKNYAFRRGYDSPSYVIPKDAWPAFRACLIAIGHLDVSRHDHQR